MACMHDGAFAGCQAIARGAVACGVRMSAVCAFSHRYFFKQYRMMMNKIRTHAMMGSVCASVFVHIA